MTSICERVAHTKCSALRAADPWCRVIHARHIVQPISWCVSEMMLFLETAVDGHSMLSLFRVVDVQFMLPLVQSCRWTSPSWRSCGTKGQTSQNPAHPSPSSSEWQLYVPFDPACKSTLDCLRLWGLFLSIDTSGHPTVGFLLQTGTSVLNQLIEP